MMTPTVHILDVAQAAGIDASGKSDPRINLTNIRSGALGDRWEGEVKISSNMVSVTTTRDGRAGGKARAPLTIAAERP